MVPEDYYVYAVICLVIISLVLIKAAKYMSRTLPTMTRKRKKQLLEQQEFVTTIVKKKKVRKQVKVFIQKRLLLLFDLKYETSLYISFWYWYLIYHYIFSEICTKNILSRLYQNMICRNVVTMKNINSSIKTVNEAPNVNFLIDKKVYLSFCYFSNCTEFYAKRTIWIKNFTQYEKIM